MTILILEIVFSLFSKNNTFPCCLLLSVLRQSFSWAVSLWDYHLKFTLISWWHMSCSFIMDSYLKVASRFWGYPSSKSHSMRVTIIACLSLHNHWKYSTYTFHTMLNKSLESGRHVMFPFSKTCRLMLETLKWGNTLYNNWSIYMAVSMQPEATQPVHQKRLMNDTIRRMCECLFPNPVRLKSS